MQKWSTKKWEESLFTYITYSILLCEYTIIYLSILLQVNIWVVFSLELFQTMLLYTAFGANTYVGAYGMCTSVYRREWLFSISSEWKFLMFHIHVNISVSILHVIILMCV